MKFIAHLSSNSIIISRFTSVSGFKKAFTTTTGAIVRLQPLSDEKAQLIGGVMGKTYVMYCDNGLDIQENDRLKDQDTGKVYKVKNGGVTSHAYGSMDYKRVICEQVT